MKEADCNLDDELRCRRYDGKNWRCRKRCVVGSMYCRHHRKVSSAPKRKNKNRNKGSQESMANVLPESMISSNNRSSLVINSSKEVQIGITKRCLRGKYKKPKIAESIVLPEEIVSLDDLSNIVTLETWRDHITPAERRKLLPLLPKGQENAVESLLNGENAVESLLNGENLNFGNPMVQWGSSVCNGEQHPDALLLYEKQLKDSKSQYLKDLRTYHNRFIDCVEGWKRLFESCDEDEEFSEKLKQWRENH